MYIVLQKLRRWLLGWLIGLLAVVLIVIFTNQEAFLAIIQALFSWLVQAGFNLALLVCGLVILSRVGRR